MTAEPFYMVLAFIGGFLSLALLGWMGTHVGPPALGRCALAVQWESGYPAQCEAEVHGWYYDALGNAWPACEEHQGSAI